jgi:hypothetical protein
VGDPGSFLRESWDTCVRCPSEVGDPGSRGKKGLRVASHELVP